MGTTIGGSNVPFIICVSDGVLIQSTEKDENFIFHPMCKAAKPTHIIFADDLTIFCKGDTSSVTRVKKH